MTLLQEKSERRGRGYAGISSIEDASKDASGTRGLAGGLQRKTESETHGIGVSHCEKSLSLSLVVLARQCISRYQADTIVVV